MSVWETWLGAIRETVELGGAVVVALAVLNAALVALLVLRLLATRRGFRGTAKQRLASHRAAARPGGRLSALDDTLRRIAACRDAASLHRIVHDGRAGLRRFRRSIRALTFSAPLLGLMGTVSGMVRTFDALGASGGGADADALAAGIAEALVTTEAGLIAAIVGMLVGRWLDSGQRHAEAELLEVQQTLPLGSPGGTPC